jgi:EmrB/QacA subfamily drug resistance transporter
MRDPLREPEQAEPQVQTTNQITGDKRWIALVAVMIAMFFSSLDQTVVSTAMPVIISELKGFNLYAWVFTGYILATAVTVPLYGRLSDMYGRKPFYIFGFLVFLVGSAVSGMSTSIQMLIFARAFQGIGAGAMMSMPRATIGDIFNPRERGRWMGLIMGVFGLSTIIGPALGGWITDNWSWHWVFYINMPVALIALGMIVYALPSVRTEHRHHIDWWGSLTLAAFLVPLLLGVTWGGTTYPWGSWQVLTLFGVAAVMLVLFLLIENRAQEPIIALQFFKNGTFSSAMVVTLMVGMSMFASMLVLPIYAQGVLGMTAENSGYLMTPMMLSFIVASIIGGQIITRTGKYRLLVFSGGFVLVVGSFLLTRLGIASHWSSVVVDMVVLGLGIGSLMPAMGTIVQNLFPYRVMGAVNATQQMGNSLAGAIASPILGTIMAASFARLLPERLPSQLKAMFALLSPAQRKALSDPQGIISLQGQAAIHQQFAKLGPMGETLFRSFLHAVRSALTTSILELFWVGLIFAAAAFLASFLIREVHLKQNEFYRQSGGQTQ